MFFLQKTCTIKESLADIYDCQLWNITVHAFLIYIYDMILNFSSRCKLLFHIFPTDMIFRCDLGQWSVNMNWSKT